MKSRINWTLFLGIGSALAVIWFGVVQGTARREIFWDHHALILVLGGTVAAALMAFPLRQFRDIFSFFAAGALFPTEKKISDTVEHLLLLTNHPPLAQIDPLIRAKFHPYLIEGYTLMRKQEWSPEEFRMLLHGRNQRFKERYGQDAKTLFALAKFPPAFGLLGATTGMIAMMTRLGDAGKDAIGPAMAIALVATFWGIAIANFVLLPLADHAQRLNGEDARLRLMIATGLVLIHENSRPAAIYEHLIGFLSVQERANPRFSQLLGSLEGGAARVRLTGTEG